MNINNFPRKSQMSHDNLRFLNLSGFKQVQAAQHRTIVCMFLSQIHVDSLDDTITFIGFYYVA